MESKPAAADVPEVGVWINHEGKGAIEIKPCGAALCGNIVWLKNPLNDQGQPLFDRRNPDAGKRNRPICGLPVIGNVKRTSEGWDEGWIYNPEEGAQYDVAFQASGNRLTVTGYKGVKLFSKTFTWTRAPADLQRCDGAATQTKAKPPTPPAKMMGEPQPAKKPTTAATPAPPKAADTAAKKPAGKDAAAKEASPAIKKKTAPAAAKDAASKDGKSKDAKATAAAPAKKAATNAPGAKPAAKKATASTTATAKPGAAAKPAAKKTATTTASSATDKAAADKKAATKPAAKKKTADEDDAPPAVE